MFLLRPEHTREVFDYLRRDPIESVYLCGLINRLGVILGDHRGRFLGARNDAGELCGVLLLSPLVVPFADGPEVAAMQGVEVARSGFAIRNIVGRRETVRMLWASMGEVRPRPRLVRDRQPVYWIDADRLRPAGPPAAIRRATLDDLEIMVESGAAMMREEVEEDPLARRPADFRRFVRERVLRGDEFLWTDDAGLCFKCNVSARTAEVAQIEGVFTPGARRCQGMGLRGLSSLCELLLRDVPRLCLYVNDFNRPAIRLYERLGFQRTFDFQSIFFSPA